MNNTTIATLVAKLGFDVDPSGLAAFERKLKQLQHDLTQMHKEAKAGLAGATGSSKQLQHQYAKGMALQQKAQRGEILMQKLSAETFKAKLQESKLTLSTQRNALVLQHENNRAAVAAIRITEAQTRANVVAQRLVQAKLRTEALQQRMQKSAAATGVASLRQSIRSANSGYGAGFGGVGAGIGGLMSGFSTLQMGLAGLAAAAYVAVASLKSFADNAVTEGEKGRAISNQFKALDVNNPAVGVAAEKRFYAKADELGVSAQSIAPDYVKGVRSLVDAGMPLAKAEGMVSSLLEFAKANNVTSDKLALALNAINQAASKNQLMAEEWKSQLAEQVNGAGKLGSLAWAKVQGTTVNPDDVKQVQAANAQLTKDMADGKIKGAKLTAFFTELSSQLAGAANKGGLLDAAKASHESNTNRLENLKAQQARDAFNQNGGELSKGRQQLDASMLEFTKALGPLNSKLGDLASSLLRLFSAITDLTTAVVYWLNRFFPKGEQPLTAPTTGATSKAYTDQLAKLETQDERDPTKQRPMGRVEQSDAYILYKKEQARLTGVQLSTAEESRLRLHAQVTPREALMAEMGSTSTVDSATRDASLKLAGKVKGLIDAAQTFKSEAAPFIAPLAQQRTGAFEGLNSLMPFAALSEPKSLFDPAFMARLLEVTNGQRQLPLPTGNEGSKALPPQVTNTNTVNVGDIVINGAEGLDAEALRKTIGDEFNSRLSSQLGPIGARMADYE